MIKINKGTKEPLELTECRATPGSSYRSLYADQKRAIREQMLREQGYLCAYCMRRIDIDHSEIEHYIPESRTASGYDWDCIPLDKDLDYQNMFAVCAGVVDSGETKDKVCHKHRENRKLTVNPLDEGSIAKIGYSKGDGAITASEEPIKDDLNVVLNLNHKLLKDGRKEALDTLRDWLGKKQRVGSWKAIAKRRLKNLSTQEKLNPYAGIIIWYLEKLIRST